MASALTRGKYFQNGYVVLDVERATAAMKEKFGIGAWHIRRMPAGSLTTAIATAWVDDLMWEFLQFDPERIPDIFRDFVPSSPEEARFNHVGYMIETEEELRAVMRDYDSAGVGTALHAVVGDIFEYYYADTAPQLGHYTEYVYLKPDGRDFFAATPRN